MLVNKTQLAEILGKSVQTLTTWQKNGMPIFADGSNGQANQYDTAAVIDWLVSREISKLSIDSEGRVHDYEMERARLTHHQANKTALEEAVLQGSLIPADKVERVQGDMVSAFRAKMLSLPTKAAHSLVALETLSEAQDAIKPFIYEALKELADYEPKQYGIDALEEGSGNGSAAARNDSKRVGRRGAQAIK